MNTGPNIKIDWWLAVMITAIAPLSIAQGFLFGIGGEWIYIVPLLVGVKLVLAGQIGRRIALLRSRTYLDGYADGMEDAADVFEAAQEIGEQKRAKHRRTGPFIVPAIALKRVEPN